MELFVVRWMELESVIQSEVSQKEKNKYSMEPALNVVLERPETLCSVVGNEALSP